jgi:hypothetical protein
MSWSAPDAPGPEVKAVRDRRGVRWCRDDDLWWGEVGHGYQVHRTWWELLARGPLTEASNE